MRRLYLLISLAFLSALITGPVFADTFPFANLCIYKTSVTVVSGSASIPKAKYLYSVIITSGITTALSTNDVTLYDSSSTVLTNRTQICAPIYLLYPGQYFIPSILQYGLTYVSSGTVKAFTIIYKEK